MATTNSSPRSLALPQPPSRHASAATASSSVSVSHSLGQRRPSDRPRLTSRKSSAVSVRTLTLRERDRLLNVAGPAASISGQTRDGTLALGRYGAQGKDGRRMVGNIQLGDGSWEGMDPDEIFRRLTVREAKKVEAKLRVDADNKQGELRTTVGERYRDLLLSTTQITALRASSLRLSALLGSVADVCATPAGGAVRSMLEGAESKANGDSDRRRDQDSEDEMIEQLPVAAHMKLLLDAPESLYAFLASESYLEAAYLWLLARMVKESLEAIAAQATAATSGTPDGRAFLPLMVRQWEVLAPFRTQIVRRATASLGYRQNRTGAGKMAQGQHAHRGEQIVQALLAIILLDSNTVLDVLGMFLAERSRSLAAILREGRVHGRVEVQSHNDVAKEDGAADLEAPARRSRGAATHERQRSIKLNAAAMLRGLSPAPAAASPNDAGVSPSQTRVPAMTLADQARRVRRRRAKTTRAFVEMSRCILETLEAVRHLFLPHEEEESGVSPLEEMLKRVQEAPVVVRDREREGSLPTGVTGQGHKRRRSRLASISMPLTSPDIAQSLRRSYSAVGGDAGSAVSTGPYLLAVNSQTILRALPSAQILLSFLPSSIQAFAPFIPASALSAAEQTHVILQRLAEWQQSALRQLSVSASTWLVDIEDIRDVCFISAGVVSALDDIKSEMDGSVALEEEAQLHDSLQRIWADRMRAIWLDKLAAIEQALREEVESAVTMLERHPVKSENELSTHGMLFNRDLAFPPAPSSTLLLSSPASTAFEDFHLPAFRTALRHRRDGRTPLLDQILTHVEAISESLHQDLLAIPQNLQGRTSLQAEYQRSAEKALERIASILETYVQREDGDQSAANRRSTFLGRLAQHLSHGPLAACGSFTSETRSASFQRRLENLRRRSLLQREHELVERAASSLLHDSRALPSPSADLSGPMQTSLIGLARGLIEEELVPGGMDTAAPQEAAAAFARRAQQMPRPNLSDTDRVVLRVMAGGHSGADESHLEAINLLQRHQVTLGPLVRGLTARDAPSADRLSILLPLGTPVLATAYSSPLPLAKPAPRFGMLATI